MYQVLTGVFISCLKQGYSPVAVVTNPSTVFTEAKPQF